MPKPVLIAICVPTLGAVSIEWSLSFRNIAPPMNTMMAICFARDSKGGEIAETRNQCVDQARAQGASHLFWLDDDVCVSRMALVALYQHHRPVVSGVYFTKSPVSEPLILPGKSEGSAPFMAKGQIESWGHGMGLTLVETSVYDRMEKELSLPKDKYGKTEFYRTIGAENSQYDAETNSLRSYGTEDLFFCDNLKRIGIKSLVDMSQFAFGWHIDMRTHAGYPQEQFAQLQSGQPVVWQTPDGPVTWNQMI